MWTKLEILIPIIAIVVSSIASFIGARIGRKDLLNQATDVLNEQGDEAILQYKVIKALLNVMLSIIDSLSKAKVINGDGEPLRKEVRAKRDRLIDKEDWRYTRYNSEVRQGLTPSDDIVALDTYIQALRDIPEQSGFPWDVEWPTL